MDVKENEVLNFTHKRVTNVYRYLICLFAIYIIYVHRKCLHLKVIFYIFLAICVPFLAQIIDKTRETY